MFLGTLFRNEFYGIYRGTALPSPSDLVGAGWGVRSDIKALNRLESQKLEGAPHWVIHQWNQ